MTDSKHSSDPYNGHFATAGVRATEITAPWPAGLLQQTCSVSFLAYQRSTANAMAMKLPEKHSQARSAIETQAQGYF